METNQHKEQPHETSAQKSQKGLYCATICTPGHSLNQTQQPAGAHSQGDEEKN